jgi:DNA-directed RNA polymerase specialized sigma24 family protein
MDRASAGDEQGRRVAFDHYVVPELGVLLHVARTMTPTDQDAEELVQDTLLRAYKGVGALRRFARAGLALHHHAQRPYEPGAAQAAPAARSRR